MRAWSDRPVPPVVPFSEVAARGRMIAGENGESEMIYESAGHPGWLVKRYRPGFPLQPIEELDRLIDLPSAMTPADRALVDTAFCWPAARIVKAGGTVGVLMAMAPADFSVGMRGISGETRSRLLDIDQLVQTEPGFFTRRGWEVPAPRERLAVARNLAAAGALLERHGVVYGDWSYANALWARGSGRVFVIDMDSCGFGERAWVECNTWDDPFAPAGTPLTVHTDRYKLAVAVLRCLSGTRGSDFPAAFDALPAALRDGPVGKTLWQTLTEGDVTARPSSANLLAVLDAEQEARTPRRPVTPVPVPDTAPSRAVVPEPRRASRPAPHRIEPDPVFAPEPEPEPEPDGPETLDGEWVPTAIAACAVVLLLLALGGVVVSLFP
ncbi:hypothetical protein [Actinocorallia longicatena]|uniref:Protein kinase domain-containing protein n=1 Tax=Actinocorallia longicatena TaxID=111803 RepID=A0ABP6QI07_9ACTN